jgi:hypothetical protein
MKWTGFSLLELSVRFPTPQITVVLLLVHAGLGCCWHHSHIRTVSACESPAVTIESSCGDGHSHGQTGHHDHSPPVPHQHQCDGERFTFLSPKPPPVQKDELLFAPCFLDTVMFPIKSPLLPSHLTHGQDPSFHVNGPPLRTHLLLGVLLI